MDPAVQFDHVCKRFRRPRQADNVVLTDICMSIASNAFTVIIGPSGSGKTTLLNLVAGFEKPTAGRVMRSGKPVSGPDRDCGFIFQTPALYPWLNVSDNVLFGPRTVGMDKDPEVLARADTLLREVMLDHFKEAWPYELSGGMRSRVALVRALINEPKLLLMDEPFAALDAHTRASMQELVLRLHARYESTTVFVTHDIDEALLLGDKVVVLSASPGSVKEVVQVPLGRPRKYEMVDDPAFVALRRELRSKVWGEEIVGPVVPGPGQQQQFAGRTGG